MPFFSFSINEIKSPLTKYNITSNKVYFSKNTELWKILNKQNSPIINFLKREKRLPVINIRKNILFCLPPSIGIGDAFEYGMAIKIISEKASFDKVAVAFSAENSFVFKDFFNLEIVYPFIINNTEMNNFDTVFHLTLEIKSLVNQKYSRSNIYEEIINFFNIKNVKKVQIETQNNYKINKISIFPLSSSPIRTMPIKILNELTRFLVKEYAVEIFLDHTSEISKFIYENINIKNIIIIDPKDKSDLISSIKNIQYGLFMDSGPLHIAKILNKRGLLFETSVSGKILLKNYNLIKVIQNKYSSFFCTAPCGLTDIFNYNNTFGCYDSLKIESLKCKNRNFKNMTNRGVKNYYLDYVRKPVGCLHSLNVQSIYNVIKKDLSL
jgi:hypothetical protein